MMMGLQNFIMMKYLNFSHVYLTWLAKNRHYHAVCLSINVFFKLNSQKMYNIQRYILISQYKMTYYDLIFYLYRPLLDYQSFRGSISV